MFRFFISLYLLLLVASLRGQTITKLVNEPVVGDIDRNFRLDTSKYTQGLPLNVTGNNCVWDFSALSGTFPIVVDSFIVPTAAPGNSAYPNATYTQHRDDLYSYYRSSSSPDVTELLGAYSPSLSLTFTNTAIVASYPIAYGYSNTDLVSGTGKANSINGFCNGSITVSADGSGTLNLWNGISIPGVLRLKSVEILTLSTTFAEVGTFKQTIYNYYKPNVRFPVLSINYTRYQIVGNTPTLTTIVYGADEYYYVAGLRQEEVSAVFAYPNPFSGELSFRSDVLIDDCELSFIDATGKPALKTSDPFDRRISALQPGIYLLEMKSRSGTRRQRLIKE